MRPPSRASLAATAVAAFVFGAAPTVGDVGSCGQAPDDLDPAAFFASKRAIDCDRCRACGLATKLCDAACAPARAPGTFPEGCRPLVHDGEVCLRALDASSCADYAGFVADEGATSPSECQFCPK